MNMTDYLTLHLDIH